MIWYVLGDFILFFPSGFDMLEKKRGSRLQQFSRVGVYIYLSGDTIEMVWICGENSTCVSLNKWADG